MCPAPHDMFHTQLYTGDEMRQLAGLGFGLPYSRLSPVGRREYMFDVGLFHVLVLAEALEMSAMVVAVGLQFLG